MTLQADFASQDYFRCSVVEVRFPIIGKVWATSLTPPSSISLRT
jgi:hypothetical protein